MTLPQDLAAYARLAFYLAGGATKSTPRSRGYYGDGPRVPTHLITWHGAADDDDGVVEVRVYAAPSYFTRPVLDKVMVFWARDVAVETIGRGIQFDWLDVASALLKPLRLRLRMERATSVPLLTPKVAP